MQSKWSIRGCKIKTYKNPAKCKSSICLKLQYSKKVELSFLKLFFFLLCFHTVPLHAAHSAVPDITAFCHLFNALSSHALACNSTPVMSYLTSLWHPVATLPETVTCADTTGFWDKTINWVGCYPQAPESQILSHDIVKTVAGFFCVKSIQGMHVATMTVTAGILHDAGVTVQIGSHSNTMCQCVCWYNEEWVQHQGGVEDWTAPHLYESSR